MISPISSSLSGWPPNLRHFSITLLACKLRELPAELMHAEVYGVLLEVTYHEFFVFKPSMLEDMRNYIVAELVFGQTEHSLVNFS